MYKDRKTAEPEPLRLRTGDINQVVAVTTRLFAHHKVKSFGAGPLDVSIFGKSSGGLLLGGVSYNTSMVWDVDETRESLIITEPRSCDGVLGEQAFRSRDLIVFRPEWCGRVEITPPGDLRNTCIPTSALLRSTQALLGIEVDSVPAFSPRIAGDTSQARRLRAMLDVLHEEPMHPNQVLERARTHWFLLELLTLWSHSYSKYLDHEIALPRSLRRACEFIDENLAEPISVVDIAAAACIGVRALTLGFVKHFGRPPWRYTLDQRLHAARHDLRVGGGLTTVTHVAHKWQFSNPGLFARYYRERFGELPRGAKR